MSQMLHEIAGVVPKEVVIVNDQEVVMELDEETSLTDVSGVIHGLFHEGAIHKCRQWLRKIWLQRL